MSDALLPIEEKCEVFVAGGSVRAVSAAVAAARSGCSVILAAPRPYLGEDMCATLRMWRGGDTTPGPITREIFKYGNIATPLHVKKTLDAVCIKENVTVRFGVFTTGILQDENGQITGCVVADRAGRQAIQSGIIVDATHRASLAGLAGASFHERSRQTDSIQRIIVADDMPDADKIIPYGDNEALRYYVRNLDVDLGDETYPRLALAEQIARDQTYVRGQVRSAEQMLFVPSRAINSSGETDSVESLDRASIGNFQPKGISRVYVLGPAADVSSIAAQEIMTACGGEQAGNLVGQAVTVGAKGLLESLPVEVIGAPSASRLEVSVEEPTRGMRPVGEQPGRIRDESTPPVYGEYDVVVAGGGTSGACAAIGAVRQGATVLVIESQEGLGGIGTVGLIGKPYKGRGAGFSLEVPFTGEEYTADDKMEWFRREIRDAGGEIWLNALVCGAVVKDDRLHGVVVANEDGRGVVLAKTVIDATGNADVAYAAGVECMFGDDPTDIALQGAGLPVRPLGAYYVNTDYLLVDESDIVDESLAMMGARRTMPDNEYDAGSMIQTRERRRIVGDHVLSYLDQIAGRTYSDSICYSCSDYDSHGYPSLLYFAMLPHDDESRLQNHPAPGGCCYTPYRCLLPRGLDGILVTGLGISMHRDASALVRMQKDLQNQGFAAGVAAAMAAEQGSSVRGIDVRELQRHLVQTGCLPEEVLYHDDSFPQSGKTVDDAVEVLGHAVNPSEAGRCLAIVLSHTDMARPFLKHRMEDAGGAARIMYAKILGFLGEKQVIPVLRPVLERESEWDSKILQGRMAEYAHLPTPIDGLIMAIGWPGDPSALDTILDKLEILDAGVTLSHHRAVALALERIGSPRAAAPLAGLLRRPDMQGYAMTGFEPLYDQPCARRRRTGALREIVLARALYHCGDHDGIGKNILEEYKRDVRGLFARHAKAVLGNYRRKQGVQ